MKVHKFKIRVRSVDRRPGDGIEREFIEDWKRAEKRHHQSSEYDLEITFPDLSWLSKIFSPERLRIIQTIREQKPESIYQLAKMLGRAPSNVLKDVRELAGLGIIELRKNRKKGQKRETLQPEYNWDGFDIAV